MSSFVVIVQNSSGDIPSLHSIADDFQQSLSAAAGSLRRLSDGIAQSLSSAPPTQIPLPASTGIANVQKVHIVRSHDGKITARGLKPGQKLISMPDGTLKVLQATQAPTKIIENLQQINALEVKSLGANAVTVNAGGACSISGPGAQQIAKELSTGVARLATLNGKHVLINNQPKVVIAAANPPPTLPKAPDRPASVSGEPLPRNEPEKKTEKRKPDDDNNDEAPKKRGRKPKNQGATGEAKGKQKETTAAAMNSQPAENDKAPKKRGRKPKEAVDNHPLNDKAKVSEDPKASSAEKVEESSSVDPCPVCYDDPLHPIKLPCGHVYCFLCAKGLSESTLSGGGACSMCRRPIDRHFFRHPQLSIASAFQAETDDGSSMSWFYEGKNGWWKFDERTNEDIEAAFARGATKEDFLICGNMYSLDFQNMLQLRKDGCGRVRRIKRDLANVAAKGIAGMAAMKM